MTYYDGMEITAEKGKGVVIKWTEKLPCGCLQNIKSTDRAITTPDGFQEHRKTVLRDTVESCGNHPAGMSTRDSSRISVPQDEGSVSV